MKTTLNIQGMHCPSCALGIQYDLEDLGVKTAEIDFVSGQAELEYDEQQLNLEKIKEQIKAGGYQVA